MVSILVLLCFWYTHAVHELVSLFSELLVVFTNNSYEVVEGGSVPVCLKTDDDLRRSVLLVLTVESSGKRSFNMFGV